MYKRIIQSIALSLFLLSTGATLAAPPEIPPGLLEEAKNSFIFVFTSDVAAKDVPGLAKGLAKKANGSVRNIYKTAIKGFAANMSASAAADLAASNPNIAYYEQNGIASIPPGKAKKGKGPNKPPVELPNEIIPWGVNRVYAYHDEGPISFTDINDATGLLNSAWIIDSGVDTGNDDLNIDTDRGRNFVGNEDGNGRKGSDIKDKNGHGTHVAGTLAAKNDEGAPGGGVVGVAPNATIVPLRVFGASGQGFVSDIVEAVDYVAESASSGDVVNMSLVTYGNFDSLQDAINGTDSSINFVVCAGNDNADISGYDPASYENGNVYTVAAMDENDTIADFSNYGDINYAAPGVGVESYVLNGEIRSWDGCSMATPHVAGIMLFETPNTDLAAGDTEHGVSYPIAHF